MGLSAQSLVSLASITHSLYFVQPPVLSAARRPGEQGLPEGRLRGQETADEEGRCEDHRGASLRGALGQGPVPGSKEGRNHDVVSS